MSLRIEINISDSVDGAFAQVSAALTNREPLHKQLASDALGYFKDFGKEKSAGEHRTAGKLGAKPTGHLERAYQATESAHDGDGASLLLPRATRLRAAFGGYELKPTFSKYLTLPVAAESYGRRAGEFDDLTFLRVGPKKTAILAQTDDEGNLKTMYVLLESVTIKEDRSLVPFDGIAEQAVDSVEAFYEAMLAEVLV